MFRFRTTLRKPISILLLLVGLIVVAGLVMDRGADELTVQTAIGQTNETFQKTDDFQYLKRANQAFINLVAQTRPSVVQITTKTKRNRRGSSQREGMDEGEQFRRFFGDDLFRRFFEFEPPDRRFFEEPEPAIGTGSGVIVSDNGYILTNNHVIEGADEITVILANGLKHPADLIGRDSAWGDGGGSDLAVLKIDAEGLPTLPFGDSDALEVGEWVVAIGTPFNLAQTVTRGIVSAKNRSRFSAYGQYIQTDAPINRGNSGGALINIRGELVGINTAIYSNGINSGNIGIGFAIPSNVAQQLMPQLIENGKVKRGWLGITMEGVDYDLAEKLNFDKPQGVLVNRVGKNSPAQKGGIQRGDVILKFDGQKVENIHHLMRIVAGTAVGKSVEVEVLRKGKEKVLTVKLGERTGAVLATLREEEETEQQEAFAGLRVQNLTPAFAERYGYSSNETGVIVTHVINGSDAEKKGIRPGHLIQEMEYTPIKDLDTYSAVVREVEASKEKRVLLYVKSPNRRGTGYVTLNLNPSAR